MAQDEQTAKEAETEQSIEKSLEAATQALIGDEEAQKILAKTAVATVIKIPAMAWTCPDCSAPAMTSDPRFLKELSRKDSISPVMTKCKCGSVLKIEMSRVSKALWAPNKVGKLYSGISR